jgi:hypothetical protein
VVTFLRSAGGDVESLGQLVNIVQVDGYENAEMHWASSYALTHKLAIGTLTSLIFINKALSQA